MKRLIARLETLERLVGNRGVGDQTRWAWQRLVACADAKERQVVLAEIPSQRLRYEFSTWIDW